MLIVIGFMGLSIPIITSALNLAGTFSTDSQVKNRIAKSQYSSIGAAEYVRYLSGEPDQWDDWLDDTGGTGQITINGDDVCFSTTEVQGSTEYSPKSEISIKKETTVLGDLVSGGSKVKIDKEAIVTGDIRAAQEVRLDEDSVVNGSIWSSGDVILKKDAQVNGNVTAGGTITLESGAMITGAQLEYQTLPNIVPSSLLTLGMLSDFHGGPPVLRFKGRRPDKKRCEPQRTQDAPPFAPIPNATPARSSKGNWCPRR